MQGFSDLHFEKRKNYKLWKTEIETSIHITGNSSINIGINDLIIMLGNKNIIRAVCDVINKTNFRPSTCNFIKKEPLVQVFSCEFYKISKNTFFYKTPPGCCFCRDHFLQTYWNVSEMSMAFEEVSGVSIRVSKFQFSGEVFVLILTKLSKAYDSLEHEILITKWNAYSFKVPTLKLIRDYLTSGKQPSRAN